MENEALEALPDEFLDELISADIDGELHAALQDLEIAASVDQVQLWFTTSSRASLRYTAMMAAAKLLSAPFAEPLDEVSKRRLVKATLGHIPVHTPGRIQRVSLALVAAAACVVLVIGIGVSMTRAPEAEVAVPSATTSFVPPATQGPEANVRANKSSAADLGTVSNVQQLREKLNDLPSTGQGGSTTTIPNDAGSETAAISAQELNCMAVLPRAESASAPAIVANAQVAGQAVAIAAARDPQGRVLRWVYRISDCAVLFSDRR